MSDIKENVKKEMNVFSFFFFWKDAELVLMYLDTKFSNKSIDVQPAQVRPDKHSVSNNLNFNFKYCRMKIVQNKPLLRHLIVVIMNKLGISDE